MTRDNISPAFEDDFFRCRLVELRANHSADADLTVVPLDALDY